MDSINKAEFAKLLRQAVDMGADGVIKDFSKKARISPSTLSCYLNQKHDHKPSVEMIEKIMAVCPDMDVNALMEAAGHQITVRIPKQTETDMDHARKMVETLRGELIKNGMITPEDDIPTPLVDWIIGQLSNTMSGLLAVNAINSKK